MLNGRKKKGIFHLLNSNYLMPKLYMKKYLSKKLTREGVKKYFHLHFLLRQQNSGNTTPSVHLVKFKIST
jgi:hypothetical protein